MAVKYLLTGAAGDLGSNVVRELLATKADIRALVLPGDSNAKKLPPEIEIMTGDIVRKADLERFFQVDEGSEVTVIHMAGIVTTYWGFSQNVFDVNVKGTQNVVDACIDHGVRKLVYVSSVHALPTLKRGEVITETTKFDPQKVQGFYGKTKAEASRIVMDAVKNRGLNASLVFPSGLCGPYDYAKGHMTQLIINSARNRLPAGVHGGYDFVDVRDVARGVVSCAQNGKKGEGYILSNRYISVEEILEQVHRQAGARKIRLMLPIGIAKLAAPFCEMYYKLKKQRPLFTKYSLYTLESNALFSNEKAKRELGYTVRPFEETIADAIAWLQTENLLPKKKVRA